MLCTYSLEGHRFFLCESRLLFTVKENVIVLENVLYLRTLKFIWSVEEVIAAWVVKAYAYPEIIINTNLKMGPKIWGNHTPVRRKTDHKYFYLLINLTLKLILVACLDFLIKSKV